MDKPLKSAQCYLHDFSSQIYALVKSEMTGMMAERTRARSPSAHCEIKRARARQYDVDQLVNFPSFFKDFDLNFYFNR